MLHGFFTQRIDFLHCNAKKIRYVCGATTKTRWGQMKVLSRRTRSSGSEEKKKKGREKKR